jgi:hypothetical protein
MITPKEIRDKTEKKYLDFLSSLVEGLPFSQLVIRGDKSFTKSSFSISVFEEIKVPKACSIALRKAFCLASSLVLPCPLTTRLTVRFSCEKELKLIDIAATKNIDEINIDFIVNF